MNTFSHILYLSYDGLTDPLGQSQVLPYILGLEQKGYSFTIISFEKPDRFLHGEAGIRQILESGTIDWIPLMYHKKPPVLSTLYDLWLMTKRAKRVCRIEKVKLVHCRSYISGLVGLRLKKKLGVKFLFDIRGFWADERVDGGLWNLSNLIYRLIYNFFKRKEAEMMISADHIISLTHSGKDEIVSGRLFRRKDVKIDEKKVTVIPCAVDLALFNPDKIDTGELFILRDQLGIQKKDQIMIYLGSLGTWYLLEEMLIFFREWSQIEPNFKFLFVTRDDHEQIREKAIQVGIPLEKLILTESIRERVPYHIALADVGLFFIKPAYSKKASSATKMGELMAMGIPIIANQGVGDADSLMSNMDSCVAVDPYHFHIADIQKKILLQKGREEMLELAKAFFSLENGVESYTKVYTLLN